MGSIIIDSSDASKISYLKKEESHYSPSLLQKIGVVAFALLRDLVHLITGKGKAFVWSVKHHSSLKVPPLFSWPPPFSWIAPPPLDEKSFPSDEDFNKLLTSYSQKKGIKKAEAIRLLNKEIRKGNCFGQCAQLFTLCRNSPDRQMEKLIKSLGSDSNSANYYQALAEFRTFFSQSETVDDSKEEWDSLYACFPIAKELESEEKDLYSKIDKASTSFDQVFFIYDKRNPHILFLRISEEKELFCFYDPSEMGGYHSFSSQEKFLKAFCSYYNSNYSRLEKDIRIEHYPIGKATLEEGEG